MRFDIITIFPNLFDSFLDESLIKKSALNRVNTFFVHDLRRWAKGKYKTVDERPYGGGAGMVLMAEPIIKAVKEIKTKILKTRASKKIKVILLTPAGKEFNQKTAKRLAKFDSLILICGRYEGVDERIGKFVDEKISIGPYVLSGGETAAMVIVETVARLSPGYMGNPNSLNEESFESDLIEYPHYTRPEVLKVDSKNYRVPKVLLSGDHKKIKDWRQKNIKIIKKK